MPNILQRLQDAYQRNPSEAFALLPELMDAVHNGTVIELPCKVGDEVYWLWCDGAGNPDCEVSSEKISYFYVDKGGVGISTDWYDGHIGHFVKSGALVDGVRRIFLTKSEAQAALGSEAQHAEDS